jgi:hypothetical protein
MREFFNGKSWHIQALGTKRYLGTDADNAFSGNFLFNQYPNVNAGFTINYNTWYVEGRVVNGYTIEGAWNAYIFAGLCATGEMIDNCNIIKSSFMGVNPNNEMFDNFPYLDASLGHYIFESLGTTGVVAIRNKGLEMFHQQALGKNVKYYLHNFETSGSMQFRQESADLDKWSPSAAFVMVEVICPAAGFF